MTESTRTSDVNPSRASLLFPTLTAAQIARIEAHGVKRRVRPGEVLFEPGVHAAPFFVVTAGEIEIVRPSGDAETMVAVQGPGAFTGEANLLHGRPSFMRARQPGGRGDRADARTAARAHPDRSRDHQRVVARAHFPARGAVLVAARRRRVR